MFRIEHVNPGMLHLFGPFGFYVAVGRHCDFWFYFGFCRGYLSFRKLFLSITSQATDNSLEFGVDGAGKYCEVCCG